MAVGETVVFGVVWDPNLLYSQKWSTEELFRESETNMRQG
jgi:hypothetical protein